jgi:GNAT superfamily N-acetyltransferase
LGLNAPERLRGDHRLEDFACRHRSLTRFLKEKALRNQGTGASNCFVVCQAGSPIVVACYTLSAGTVARESASSTFRRNMPDPIPVALLGRLAVHEDFEGSGIGSGMLKDATARCIRAAQEGPGTSAILCHAIDDAAKAFYIKHGFVQSPIEPLTVMLSLAGFRR